MDWRRWHEEYDEPGSRLGRRLEVVRSRAWEVLDRTDADEPRLLSLCGGDARDIVPVLRDHPEGRSVEALVVELDEILARRAQAAVRDARLAGVEVRCADAGDPASFADFVPVDVLLLCGIFGNIEGDAVRDVIRRAPSIVRRGGHVIWTRGAGDDEGDDPRERVRRWFVEAGMPEVSFDGPPERYGVGVNHVPEADPLPVEATRLFTFVR